MKIWLFIFALASLLFLTAARAEQPIDRAPIEQFLTAFDSSSLPRVDLSEIWASEIVEMPLDPRAIVAFSELNQVLFGKPLFKLRSCRRCKLIANLATFEIYVDPIFIDESSKRARSEEEFAIQLRFMFAHELSHYLYELACQRRLKEEGVELSPNGNKSFRALIKAGVRQSSDHIHSHAEVDVMAVVILERMGIARAREVVIDLLEQLNFPGDGAFRIRTLRALE